MICRLLNGSLQNSKVLFLLIAALLLLHFVGLPQIAGQENQRRNNQEQGSQAANDELPSFRASDKRTRDFFEIYSQRLHSVLKTRLRQEQAFVDQVVELVEEGKIPKSVVDQAWLWVRSNRSASRYPFVYFERVLRLQCQQLKIELPAFDRSIYSQARRNTTSRRRR